MQVVIERRKAKIREKYKRIYCIEIIDKVGDYYVLLFYTYNVFFTFIFDAYSTMDKMGNFFLESF